MHHPSRFYTAIGMALLLATAVSCNRTTSRLPTRDKTMSSASGSSAEVARTIVEGRVGALIYVDRARGHAVAKLPAAYDVVGALLDETGIDAIRDIDRAFITAPTSFAFDKVVVLSHSVSEQGVTSAMHRMVGRAGASGEVVGGLGFEAARVTLGGERRLVAAPEPGLIVMLPSRKVDAAHLFVGSGGFPDPQGDEVVVFFAFEPRVSLESFGLAVFPQSIVAAQATLSLDKVGGANLVLDAQSTTPLQAQSDALSLTRAVDAATSVDVLGVRLRTFQAVRFRAEGQHVRADIHLLPEEIDWLVAMALGPA